MTTLPHKLTLLTAFALAFGLSSIAPGDPGTEPAGNGPLTYQIPQNAVRKRYYAMPSSVEDYDYFLPGGERVGYEEIDIQTRKTVRLDLFRGGKQHGIQLQWYPNGVLKSSETYRDGVRDGAFKYWDEQGQLIGDNTITAGNGTIIIYFSNGRIHHQESYEKNLRAGPYYLFFPNGQMLGMFAWKKDQVMGPSFGFWDDGRLSDWHDCDEQGNNNGPACWFSEDGKFTEKEFYIHGGEASEAYYIDARKADPSLPEFHDDPAWFAARVTPELKALIAGFKNRPPVKIPLDAHASAGPTTRESGKN